MDDKCIFQWSKFINGEEQIVIRGNDFKEFILNVDMMKARFVNGNGSEQTTKPAVADPTPLQTPSSRCEICAADASIQTGTNKNGNPYKLVKCSVDYKHNKFLKP